MAKIGAWSRYVILQYQHHAKHLGIVTCYVYVFEDMHLSGQLEPPGDGAIGYCESPEVRAGS